MKKSVSSFAVATLLSVSIFSSGQALAAEKGGSVDLTNVITESTEITIW